MRSIPFGLGLLLLASPALADIAPPGPPSNAPAQPHARSVWMDVEAGAVTHLQSGLLCPERMRQYARTKIETFDLFGLDVGCNYLAQRTDITIYLTRRSGGGIDAAMTEARREFETTRAAEHPQPLAARPAAGGGLDWTVALYAADSGLREGIWIADLNGWTLEYRATYHAEDEQAALDDLGAFTVLASKSAGERLSLCAKSASPDRTGRAITNSKEVSDSALMTSILGGAALAGASKGGDNLDRPVIWCVERPIEQGGYRMLFWRAVDADGRDGGSDQLSQMTDGPPPTLIVGEDGGRMGALMNSLNGKKEKWTATMRVDRRTVILGYFDSRPPPETVSDLFVKILKGDAKAVGGYSADGKNITIMAPPDGK